MTGVLSDPSDRSDHRAVGVEAARYHGRGRLENENGEMDFAGGSGCLGHSLDHLRDGREHCCDPL